MKLWGIDTRSMTDAGPAHEQYMSPELSAPHVVHITTIDLSLRILLLNQLISLQKAGYRVSTISSPGTDTASLKAHGIEHIPVRMTRRFSPFADLRSLWELSRALRRLRPTIVHTHNPKPGLLGQLAARMAGVPIVVNTIHGFYFHDDTPIVRRAFYVLMEKIAARCSDIILSQNSEDIDTAISERICRPNQIKFLGNGIDIDRFSRKRIDAQSLDLKREEIGLETTGPVVGFVGRLVAEKGVLELIEATNIVAERHPNVRFLFVGPTDEQKSDAISVRSTEGFGAADRCLFLGMREDMPELYALMDVFVLPSHREGFPRSPMEASAMSVPCVVTNIRGCREAVYPGRNGLLVPVGNVEELAEAIHSLLTNKEEATRLGAGGRTVAEEHFDERLVFERVKAEYRRLLNERHMVLPAIATPSVTTADGLE